MARTLIVILTIGNLAGMSPGIAQEKAPPSEATVDSTADVSETRDEKTGHVKRAVFTNAIVEREPTDQVDTLTTQTGRVYFFTEIVGMEGKTVTHRWILNDETAADVSFEIGGPRWRVYSSKKLLPEWVGTWTVEVLDGEGNSFYEDRLIYKKTE